ncbi:MAG: hypothetical protein HS108_14205 [Planctomycetes bacterium]|jgi:tetratricopeptide (TPR) repeat protein|nr:hypothetical protein [Planctomycetota bacterium]MCL4730953.1 hypothetical protein [Planctomycetota bacterium]
MRTRLPVLFLTLLLLAGTAAGQAADAEAKFAERAARVNAAVADALAKLGADCLKQGLNAAAATHLRQALEHDAANERARKALGHEKKKVDGQTTWVPDPKKAPPADDAKGVTPQVRAEYRKARDKLYADTAKELVGLGQYATKLGLDAHARASFGAALRYNPLHEDALRGAGWVKDGPDWISPAEVLEREAVRKALDNPPDSRELETVPQWAQDLGDAGNPVTGQKAGNLTILGSGSDHAQWLRLAAAVRTLAARALGGEGPEMTLFVARNRAQQQAYAVKRHPGSPGLAAEQWCVAVGEIAVERDEKDDKLTHERIVLAAALHEVRARCGEPSHTWFEIGYVSNLTRRLCGSVALTPFSGNPSGPTESGRWKRTLLQQVAAETQPRLDRMLAARDPDEGQAMLAHFFTRFLIYEHAACLEPFCAAVKGGSTMEEALRSATQSDVARLEDSFLGWLQRGG